MSRSRMEAFSDGVLAIIITIMVLKITIPASPTLASLKDTIPVFLAYILSFVYVGIYWVNHHHLTSGLTTVSGRLLWKNLFWMFWMSLIPMATEWLGANPMKSIPAVFYGFILLICAIAYNLLQYEVIKVSGEDSCIAKSIGKNHKGLLSAVAYAIAIIFDYFFPIGV